MGLTPPTPPPDYGPGNDCPECFEPGQTPNYVFVKFHDVTACAGNPSPPNGITFVCAQNPLANCQYEGVVIFGGLLWYCTYYLHIFAHGHHHSVLQMGSVAAHPNPYYAEDKEPCATEFDNSYTVCPGWGGAGGHAHVGVFSAAVVIGLTNHYHFVTVPKTFYEFFDCGIDHYCFRLASHFDKTNVLFLIEKEEFEILPADHPGHF